MSVKSIIALSVAFAMSVGIGLFIGTGYLDRMRANNNVPVFDALIIDDLSDVKAPDGAKSPADYDALYNFRYAKKRLNAETAVSVKVNGDVYSIMNEHQVVETVKQFNGTEYFYQSISLGTFAKVYQRMFYRAGEDKVYRSDEYKNGKFLPYGEIKVEGKEGYIEIFGSQPKEYIPYIINKDSVKAQTQASVEAGGFELKFELDPKIAANNYKRFVKQSAGSMILPVHSVVNITVTIDGSWNIQKLYIEETYRIKKDMGIMGAIEAECRSTSTEVYTIGQPVEIDSAVKP